MSTDHPEKDSNAELGGRRERRVRSRRGRAAVTADERPLPRIRAGHRVFLHDGGDPLLGPGTFDLLMLADETGSLHQAAKRMGMSYNKAWRAVRHVESHLGVALLARRTGGAGGGGSMLTDEGRQLTECFRAFLDAADADLSRLYKEHFKDVSFIWKDSDGYD